MAGIFACPKCTQKTYVIDSRSYGNVCTRRRRCGACRATFNTEERFTSFNKRIAKRGDALDLILKDEAVAFASQIGKWR